MNKQYYALILATIVVAFFSYIKEGKTLEFEQFELKNGMNVIVIPDHRSAVVLNSVWYRAGSMDEKQGKTGIAHMLEHLMFKGTKKVPDGEFSKIVQRNGGEMNAFTSRDYTAYYEKVSKDKLDLMMSLEADRMMNLTLNDADFQPERSVVLEERLWRTDSKPTDRFFEKLIRKHYQKHTYGHPIIGWRDDIEGYTLEDAVQWYNTHYAPNNATMILVGDITAEEAKPLAEKHFGNLAKKPTPDRLNEIEPLRNEPVEFIHEDKELKVPIFYRIFRAPSAFQGIAGGTQGVDDALALTLMSEIIGASDTGRLYEELVKKQQIADAASADYDAVAAGESSIDIYVQPKPGITLKQVEKVVEDVIATFIEKGVTDDEFARAKTSLLSSDIYSRDDSFYTMYRLGLWLMAGGSADTFEDWKKTLKTLTPKDMQRVAKTYFNKQTSTTGLLISDQNQLGK